MKLRTRFYLRLPKILPGKYREWRDAVHKTIERDGEGFSFPQDWRLSLVARVYLPKARWHVIDLDNCLKVLMDALQGAVTGQGKKLARAPIVIPNDNQVYKVAIAKAAAGERKVGGRVVVQRIPGKHQPTGRRPRVAPE